LSANAAKQHSRFPLLSAVLLALIVASMNIGLWWWGNLPHGPEDWHGKIGGFALSAFQRYQSPLKSDFPSDEEIDSDLKLVGKYTSRVRTYSMLQNPQVPRLAER
jgi:exo-beta-1,3-glucanase (GH17 family)